MFSRHKAATKPSRSYAMRCGLLSDDISVPLAHSAVFLNRIPAADIDRISQEIQRPSFKNSENLGEEHAREFLQQLYLSESEMSRLKQLSSLAPDVDELMRVWNRYGLWSLSNRLNESSKQERLTGKIMRKEDREALREQEKRKKFDDILIFEWEQQVKGEKALHWNRVTGLSVNLRACERSKATAHQSELRKLEASHELIENVNPKLLLLRRFLSAFDAALLLCESNEVLDTEEMDRAISAVLQFEGDMADAFSRELAHGGSGWWLGEQSRMEGRAAAAHIACARRLEEQKAHSEARRLQWAAAARWLDKQMRSLSALHADKGHQAVSACQADLMVCRGKAEGK